MKVAIDSGPLKSGHSIRGVGVSTKGLIEALLKYNTDKSIKIEPVDFLSTDLNKYDVLHYTSFNPFFLNIPRIGSVKAKTVLHIHDLIPLIYKKNYQPGIMGSIRWNVNKYLVEQVDAVVTVSETSKKDIVRFLNIKNDKINVVYWALGEEYKKTTVNGLNEIKKLYKLPEKFVLYTGDVNFNKNLTTLIDAVRILGIPLVVVGKQAGSVDELVESWKNLKGPMDIIRSLLGRPHPEIAHFEKLRSMMQENNVITTGYVPVSDLTKIFKLSTVYCQPSYYEGFGIPVLEAFASEVPGVVSKTQALTEVAAGAALIANPYDPNDMANKISSLIKDSTERLHYIRAGLSRVKDFSWQETSRKMVEVYRKVDSE